MLLVAEVLGHRERGERDAETGTRRLVHLAVDQTHLGSLVEEDEISIGILDGMALLVLLHGDDAGLDHFAVEVVTLAGTLADTSEERVTAVSLGDVVDELHDDDGLADAGAAEGAHLATLGEGADQIDDLDSGLEHLGLGVLRDERRSAAVDRKGLVGLDGTALVAGLAEHVEDASENPLAHGDGDRLAKGADGHAALQTLGGGHGEGADPVLAEVLLDL